MNRWTGAAMLVLAGIGCTEIDVAPFREMPTRMTAFSQPSGGNLEWEAVAGATGYVVFWAADPAIGPETFADIAGAMSGETLNLSMTLSPISTSQDTFVTVAPKFGGKTGRALPAVAVRGLVDPIFTTQGWIGEGGDLADRLGDSLVAADLDGDRRGDLVSGSPTVTAGDGELRTFFGAPGGPVDLGGGMPTGIGYDLGASLVTGDFDGDGVEDLVVGAPGSDGDQGRIRFVRGGGGFPLESPELQGSTGDFRFGCGLAGGDLDGDGDLDLAVGEADAGSGGSVHLLLNEGDGTFDADTFVTGPILPSPDGPGSGFGCIVAFADVDGDGYDDLLAGEPQTNVATGDTDEGRVVIWFGSAAGLSGSPDVGGISHGNSGDRTGQFVASAGDLDGDGFEDFAVGLGGNNTPILQVYLGAPRAELGSSPDPVAEIQGSNRSAAIPVPMIAAAAGDLDGDGFGDLLVADPRSDDSSDDAGRVDLWFGTPGGGGLEAGSVAIASGETTADECGMRVAVSDLDGDGWTEIVVGEPGFAGQAGVNTGRIRSFRGQPNHGVVVDPGPAIAARPIGTIEAPLATFDDPDPRAHACEFELDGVVRIVDPCFPEQPGVGVTFQVSDPGIRDLRFRVTAADGRFGEARVRVTVEADP